MRKRRALIVAVIIGVLALTMVIYNYYWSTKLINAINSSNVTKVQQLIDDKGLCSINFPGGGAPYLINVEFWPVTPLQSACKKGNYTMIRTLLNNGANPNASSPAEYSPLVLILYHSDKDDLKTVELLVHHGVDLEKTYCTSTMKPILYAAGSSPYNVDRNEGKHKYNAKKAKRITEIYVYLLNHVTDKTPKDKETGENALLLSARMFNVPLAEYVVKEQGIKINSVDKEGKTALYLEPDNKNNKNDPSIKMTKLLIELGIDVNVKDDKGKTAYDYAVAHHYKYLIPLLR
ncbi:MAG: hypothetical protein GX671_08890 [Clostridiales bacterium]|nr:hypothetical protein [Clostridiales bacterium]